MANPFAALMPFLQAAGIGLPPEAVGEDINVLRRQDAAPQTQAPLLGGTAIDPEASPLSLDNRRFIQQRDETAKRREEFAPRKGMFGIKGTLRDVLGALGDNYLMQSGQKPRYQAMREQERLQDAMAGFTQMDPRAVAENLTGVNSGAGMDFYKDAVGQQQAAQRLQQQGQAQEAAVQKGSQEAFQKGAALYSNALRGMTQTGRYNPQLLSRIQQSFGLPEEFAPPLQFNPDWAEPFIRAGTPVTQQENVALGQQRLQQQREIAEMNDATRRATDNPPVPRQPTRLQEAEDLYRRALSGDKEAGALFERMFPPAKRSRTRTPAKAAGTPTKGMKKGGYTFQGGDPSDKRNWKKD